jgi:hypothetical protein
MKGRSEGVVSTVPVRVPLRELPLNLAAETPISGGGGRWAQYPEENGISRWRCGAADAMLLLCFHKY